MPITKQPKKPAKKQEWLHNEMSKLQRNAFLLGVRLGYRERELGETLRVATKNAKQLYDKVNP